MVEQVHIKNYKSIKDLKIDLGRLNLFIGENGCGKTNILEAIGVAGATTTTGINNTLLISKGIRLSKPELMASAFDDEIPDIGLSFKINKQDINYLYRYQNDEKGEKWINVEEVQMLTKLASRLMEIASRSKNTDFLKVSKNEKERFEIDIELELLKDFYDEDELKKIDKEGDTISQYFLNLNENPYLHNFMIYSPELSYLRRFDDDGQADPLGYRGEGLFSLLKESFDAKSESLDEIKEVFDLIDWYEDFFIPNDLLSNEFKINIKDRFIDSKLKFLDQRSVNEGFLFLLFYSILLTNDKTPVFFAVDNFDLSFNPKLCTKVLRMIYKMAKKHKKQILLTTHNPAAIDGIDITDDDQRLFVVRRNIHGHTIVKRIFEKPSTTRSMKLSEAWMKGLLGGLPNNF